MLKKAFMFSAGALFGAYVTFNTIIMGCLISRNYKLNKELDEMRLSESDEEC